MQLPFLQQCIIPQLPDMTKLAAKWVFQTLNSDTSSFYRPALTPSRKHMFLLTLQLQPHSSDQVTVFQKNDKTFKTDQRTRSAMFSNDSKALTTTTVF